MKSSTTTTSSNGTLTTSNSGGTLTTSYNGNINYVTTGYSAISTIYHILGEDFESNYLDGTTTVMISTLNVLGRPFYEELKKNKISFPQEMDEFIQQRLKVLERDMKIESIIENKPE